MRKITVVEEVFKNKYTQSFSQIVSVGIHFQRNKMNNKIIKLYFIMVTSTLYSIAALPERIEMKSKLKTFLFNTVWPAAFFSFWTPLVPMVTIKIYHFMAKKEWEDFLATMHMYFLGCNTLYMCFALQKTARLFKNAMEKMQYFIACNDFGLKDLKQIFVLWIVISCSFFCYVSGSMYYGEVLVPVWIPFIDNDQPLSKLLFFAIWAYEGLAGIYMVFCYGVLYQFPVISTIMTRKELNFLAEQMKGLKFIDTVSNVGSKKFCVDKGDRLDRTNSNQCAMVTMDSNSVFSTEKVKMKKKLCGTFRAECYSESDTNAFTRSFVQHHQYINSVISEVSNIHHYVFLTQVLFTVGHSCFLAFNMYYTERLQKVIVKSSPILALSYYLLYIYCWNGQRLTDSCERLYRALYEGEWYNCPQSFKTSLKIIMMYCGQPVKYSGGGIFTASFETFLTGLQQSISYILLLKQMTPENKKIQ